MGIPSLFLVEAGTGKSASLRNCEPDDVSIFKVAAKPLPLRKKHPIKSTSDYNTICQGIAQSQKKAFVIDDSQYLLCFESFAKAKEIGYGKFTDMALHFYNLVQFVIRQTPPDVIVYFLHHTETDGSTGKDKAKTSSRWKGSFLLFSWLTRTARSTPLLRSQTASPQQKAPWRCSPWRSTTT